MYKKAYGIIETLTPLHVGASAGEETGNLNLIFRDQFTQTGIIPGSSIRGRFRADMRSHEPGMERTWYGHEALSGEENTTTEALVKFEYASLVWLPVFCPGQPIVWVTCPWLLKRYKQITGISANLPDPYTAPKALQGRQVDTNRKVLFFNLGFIEIEHDDDLTPHKQPPGAKHGIPRMCKYGDDQPTIKKTVKLSFGYMVLTKKQFRECIQKVQFTVRQLLGKWGK